jgi:hypothetical protein
MSTSQFTALLVDNDAFLTKNGHKILKTTQSPTHVRN